MRHLQGLFYILCSLLINNNEIQQYESFMMFCVPVFLPLVFFFFTLCCHRHQRRLSSADSPPGGANPPETGGSRSVVIKGEMFVLLNLPVRSLQLCYS